MATNEQLLDRLTKMMEDEKKKSIEREERMQQMLENALQRIPDPTQRGAVPRDPKPKIPSNATPAPMLTHSSSLREFSTWKQKYQDYCLLTDIHQAPINQQKAVLRSLLDDEWYRITRYALNINMDDDDVTTEEIINEMQDHLRSQRNIVLDRKEFFMRNQQHDEKFDDYIIALQEIAGFCDFCNHCMDDQYRDRIVTGITNEDTIKDLLAEKKLTLERTIEICRANENVNKDTENLQGATSSINRIAKYKQPQKTHQKQQNNHKFKTQQRFPKQCSFCGGEWHEQLNQCPSWRKNEKPPYRPKNDSEYKQRSKPWENNKFQSKKCRFCGGEWHEQLNQCPARDKQCGNCGESGHFARYCINEVAYSSEDDKVWRITVAGVNESSYKKRTPKVELTAIYEEASIKLEATPDTGAEMTVVGVKEAKRTGANLDNLKPCKTRLYAADGKQLTCIGILPVYLCLGDKKTKVELVVVAEVKGCLLSWYHAIELGILPKCFPNQINVINKETESNEAAEMPPICSDKQPSAEVRKQHEKLLRTTFKSVFDVKTELKPMKGKPMKILLKEDAIPFALTAARSIPFAWKSQIKSQLEDMIKKKIIAEVTEPTDWCHAMLPAPKKDSKEVRVCVDLTQLNKYVRRGAHPVITPQEAVSGVTKGSTFYTVLDAKAGYWQVEIAEEDQELTTFITPWGRYKFLRAPMGLSISGDEYNRRGDEALQTTTSSVKIVDDILSYEADYQQHLNNVWHILSKCKEYGITLNPDKLKFAEEEVDYCGYHLSKNGFIPNEAKVTSLIEFKTPTNLTELQSFLGLANQLSQFSTQIAELAEPLRQLLKKSTEWTWSDAHEKSFLDLKEALSKPPILAFYDPKLPITVHTDAARLKGLGYACLQLHGKTWRLVQCGSRFLTDTESRYSTIELELLAIVWAMKKCHSFLAGRDHFDVITDHKPLLSIVNLKSLAEIENPRLQRLKERLIPYSFTLGWKKGSDHAIPDALSRAPTEVGTKEDEIAEQEIEEHVHAVVAANIRLLLAEGDQFQDSLVENLYKNSTSDPEYNLLKNTIINGFPANYNEVDPIIRPYAKVKDSLSVDEELVVYGSRLVVPRKLRKDVLQRLHSSHQGIGRTRSRARQSVYWPGIDNDIKNIVEACKDCHELLPSQQKEPFMSEEEPSRPFESTSGDYFSHAGKTYLIYVDRLSGWPMVKMYNQEATAAKLITTLRKFFAATGIPEVFRSDNGPQLTAGNFRRFLQNWAVRISPSSPYYPQSNGHAEAAVKSVKNLIIKCTNNGNLDTDEFAHALLELRNTPRSDGLSPAQVLFGHPIRSIIPVHQRAYKEKWQKDESFCKEKRVIQKKKAEKLYNTTAKPLPELSKGDNVSIQDHRTGRWTSTGTIVEVGSHRQYLVKRREGRALWRNRRFIRRYRPLMSPVTYPEQLIPNKPKEVEHTPPILSPSPPASPPNSPLFKLTMPKLDQSKIINAPFELPKMFFEKMPCSQVSGRTRKAPDRLQIDHKRKTYTALD